MDSLIYFDSGNRGETDKDSKEHSISQRLVSVPFGYHYLILYSNIGKARMVYAEYIKAQIEVQPDSVIIMLPFYDTSDKVREVLKSEGVDVKGFEKDGNLIIVDIEKVINNPYYAVSEVERLRAFIRHIENEHPGKSVFVIADMSAFNHLKKCRELLDYERNLHKYQEAEKWKELCFYHKNDFQSMFTEKQAYELLDYHKDQVITV
jgi:DNA polymerase elongation subunit (family B)